MRLFWLMELFSTEYQPVGILMDPHLSKILEFFLDQRYREFTADEAVMDNTPAIVQKVFVGAQGMSLHNFVFYWTGVSNLVYFIVGRGKPIGMD